MAVEPNSVTYWESRQVNIGDYENVSFGGTSIVKFIPINQQEKKVEISQSDLIEVYPQMSEEDALLAAQKRVRTILDGREKELRLQVNNYANISYDALKKAEDFGIITKADIGITDTGDVDPVADIKIKTVVKNSNKKTDDEFDPDFDDFDDPSPKKIINKAPKNIPEKGQSKFVTKAAKTGLFAANKSADPKPLNTDEEIPY